MSIWVVVKMSLGKLDQSEQGKFALFFYVSFRRWARSSAGPGVPLGYLCLLKTCFSCPKSKVPWDEVFKLLPRVCTLLGVGVSSIIQTNTEAESLASRFLKNLMIESHLGFLPQHMNVRG